MALPVEISNSTIPKVEIFAGTGADTNSFWASASEGITTEDMSRVRRSIVL
jgi:hypothetical protein